MSNAKIKGIGYSRKFLKQLKKAPLPIQVKFRSRLELFKIDKFNFQLNNHSLTGNYLGCKSINVTGDWRAIYMEQKDGVVFVAFGTHSQLYR